MRTRIVNEHMMGNVRLLDGVTSTLKQIQDYPWKFMKEKLDSNDRIGSRTFCWTIRALEVLTLDPENDYALQSDDLDRISLYVAHHYSPEEISSLDPFWRVSLIEAIDRLLEIAKVVGKSSTTETFTNMSSEYNDCAKAAIKDMSRVANSHRWYTDYWNHIGFIVKPRIILTQNQWNRPLKYAREILQEQIALKAINHASFNPILLSSSASLLWHSNCGEPPPPGSEIEFLIRKAADICFNQIKTSTVTNRVVFNEVEFGDLHNLPLEDLFMILDLPSRFLPEDTSLISRVINYIEARIVSSPLGCKGTSEESFNKYPTAADYFSNYCVVVLSKLHQLLRSRLRNQFADVISKVDPSYLVYSDVERDFDKMYDTFEGTVKYVKEKLPTNQAEFTKNLNQFNTMLLFGPPGTGKTTFLEALVSYLNKHKFIASPTIHKEDKKWIGITLTPGMFLVSDSFSTILENIESVFSVIVNVDHCVILFDEAEELIRDRLKEDQRFGRMFTAAMLLHFNKLKHGHCIYLAATNFIEKMDSAAIRKGRFSIRKGLGWIDSEELKRLIAQDIPLLTVDVRSILADKLQNKPVKEIFDILNVIKKSLDDVPVNVSFVNTLLEKWKPYIDDEMQNKHLDHCRKFDDTYIPQLDEQE